MVSPTPHRDRIIAETIVPGEDGRLCTDSGSPFADVAYSSAKYGSTVAARRYGYLLADKLVRDKPHLVGDRHTNVLVMGPVRSYLPKGAQAIANFLLQSLNHHRFTSRLPAARPVDALRLTPQPTDRPEDVLHPYSSLQRDQRAAMMDAVVDYVDPYFIAGAHVLVVDDMLVTGVAEQKVADLLDPLGPKSVCYLYATRLEATTAELGPGVEYVMNMACSPTLTRIAALADSGDFALNDRVVDLIFTWPDADELATFFRGRSSDFLDVFFSEVMMSGYYDASTNPGALEALRTVLRERGHPLYELFTRPGTQPAGRTDPTPGRPARRAVR